MEAVEETLTYRDDTGPNKKLLPEGKDNYSKDIKNKAQIEAKSDESNYVDMDMKSEGAKTVTVSFTGEANQLSVIKCDGCKQGANEKLTLDEKKDTFSNKPPLKTEIKDADSDQARENEGHASSECSERVQSESDELHYTDMCLNSKTEDEDDEASAVLSDHYGFDTVEDESHYITTHEIQLTELDHDVDYDVGRGTWEFEDDNLVYSFVDYASLESNDTHEGTLILQGKSQVKVQAHPGGPVVSTEQDESDLCDSDKFASSDESLCKNQRDAGKIHLSIQTSSRAVNELDSGDRGHFSFVSPGARAGPMCDRAQYFIPAPGRQHLATKLRRKDINEYSSGASSSISELDDADKEVRNLTAKSFRSLACPYFDTINLSTSSESSISEYGLNKWSAYVDWNYGNISRGKEHSIIAHKTTKLEMNQATDSKGHGRSLANMKSPQDKMHTLDKKEPPISSSTSSEQIKLGGPVLAKQRGVTLNFHCNVETGVHEGTRHPKCFSTQSREVTGTVLARSGCEMQYHQTDATGDTHKKAIFASSLLKNVISKKMQFEKERKMERGEIRDTHSHVSPCFHINDPDVMKVKILERNMQRQTSESGSRFTVNSADELHFEDSRASSCDPADEHKYRKDESYTSEKGQQDKRECSSPKAPLSHTHSAYDAQKHEMLDEVKDTEVSTCRDKDSNSMLTKLLFVPSCQLLTKDKDFSKEVSLHAPVAGTATAPEKCEKEFKMYSNDNIVKKEAQNGTGKKPEIKICLRSVKENKGCTLNIASLLTPKISYNTVNTLRAAGVAKCPILSASDKMPNFTVRDMRDTKCKFQTPIYQVRDVRKLVKSSYRFVALDNGENKNSTAALTADTVDDITSKKTVKQLLPAPIVIKCQSVKTNVKQQRAEESQKQTEAGSLSPKIQTSQSESLTLSTNKVPAASKELNPDHLESLSSTETKLIKQRLERISGELVERKNEPKIPKQAALEKIKAAVKSMEQLYIYDRNEWKRKNQIMHPIAGSHVLSLIASEEKGEEVDTVAGRLTDTERVYQAETYRPHETKGSVNIMHVPFKGNTFKTHLQQNKVGNKSVLCLGNSNKSHISISTVSNAIPHSSTFQTLSTMKSSKTSSTAPLSVKIEPPKCGQVEKGKVRIASTNPSVTQAISDSENYLTIPGLTSEIKLLNSEPGAKAVNINEDETKRTKPSNYKSSPLIMEYPASQTYHHSAVVPQHVLCFSPTVPTVSPTPSGGDTRLQTQRKMLLDPTTGHYYLVDTPVQTTKRLYDPDTGQFVDVPMSHSPVSPVTPVTQVPLSLSPLACAQTYMIYPGFIPSPTLTTQTVLHRSPCHSEEATREKFKGTQHIGMDRNSPVLAERMYYSATGEAPQHEQLPVTLGHVTTQGHAASSERKPLISITTPQGPRIIAPPSFDGTTMSFVVEHR